MQFRSLIRDASALGVDEFNGEVAAAYGTVTGQDLPLLIRRKVYHAQSGFADAIASVQSGKTVYLLVTMKANDRRFTLRHYVPLALAAELQAAWGCMVVVHLLDTKTCLVGDGAGSWAAVDKMVTETIKDILAVGFVREKTWIVLNSRSIAMNYVLLCDLQRSTPLSEFGALVRDSNMDIGEIDVAFQSACFASPAYVAPLFPAGADLHCLMILRDSQKPLYDFACRIASCRPAGVFGGFVPALDGLRRMPAVAKTALVEDGARRGASLLEYQSIYFKNTEKEIKTKVGSALSGGKDTRAEQEAEGANLEVDVPIYFLRLCEPRDDVFQATCQGYQAGPLAEGCSRILTGTVKQQAAGAIWATVKAHQAARNALTTGDVAAALR